MLIIVCFFLREYANVYDSHLVMFVSVFYKNLTNALI